MHERARTYTISTDNGNDKENEYENDNGYEYGKVRDATRTDEMPMPKFKAELRKMGYDVG